MVGRKQHLQSCAFSNESNRVTPASDHVSLCLPLFCEVSVYVSYKRFNERRLAARLACVVPRLSVLQTGLDETRALLSEYSRNYSAATGTTRGDSVPPSPLPEEGVGSTGTPPSNIELLEGDVTDAPWADVSLVYAASRDFDDTAMLALARRCLGLRDGARVVTLDKPLPSVLSDLEGEDTGAKEEFQVAWQCQVEGYWGGSAVAFVHHRVAPRP